VSSNWASTSGGGGIYSFGPLTLNNSTVSGNEASFGNGGGIISSGSPLTLNNSTVSGNSTDIGDGGGILSTGPLTLTHATLTGNSATFTGANLASFAVDPVTMRATIIANPLGAGNCQLARAINSQGHNLEFPGNSCGLEGQGNPKLAPLANNGGPTMTHALKAGSAAIDQVTGEDPGCPPPATDQRGFARPKDGDGSGDPLCDIGAFEKKKR
jgi:hypothetical protein